jgi:thiol-disulfide isomerase/thioredoxin
MKTKQIVISLFLLLAIILASCSPQAAPTDTMAEKSVGAEIMAGQDDAMMEDDSVMTEKEEDSIMDDQDEAMTEQSGDDMMEDKDMEQVDDMSSDTMMSADWYSLPLVNVHTGETFTIEGLKGKVILVETMAIWCSNCLKQQGQVQELHKLLSEREDFVSLGIDIDPNENAEVLKSYIDKNGFGWWYTVAPTELAREIGQLYGDQFLNPPSTPMLIIDSHGEVHPLPFGIKSAESLLDALQPFLDGEM